MTNLEGILKSRDLTLLTKVRIVKAVVFPRWHSGKESTCQCWRFRRLRFDPWVGKIPWSRKWQHTPVFLPGKFYGQRRLAGYSPWNCKEFDSTEHTHTPFFQ